MFSTVELVENCKYAVSILEKLHVPEGWCSSGFSAKEYTPMSLESCEQRDWGSWTRAIINTVRASAFPSAGRAVP